MKTFEDDPGLITESRRMGKPPMRWIQEIQQESLKEKLIGKSQSDQ
jgi:hypothetical protein